jgi:hypothetical protein
MPLTELSREETEFIWEESQETAFRSLREKLCSSEALAYPYFKSDFIPTTDASKVGVAAIVSKFRMESNGLCLMPVGN